MEGILIAVFLGWLGGYRFYKRQYGLFLLYFFTAGIFGIGWLVDIFCAISDSSKKKSMPTTIQSQPQLQQAPVNKPLRTYTIRQADLLQGFEKLQVNTTYELVQDGIRTLRTPNPNNPTHPYTINIGNADIVFKEMEYRTQDGLECFQIFANNHHIGTIFDSNDNLNRFYIQAMIQGKVDACHVEITPKPIYAHDQNDYEYETKLWMHLKG